MLFCFGFEGFSVDFPGFACFHECFGVVSGFSRVICGCQGFGNWLKRGSYRLSED